MRREVSSWKFVRICDERVGQFSGFWSFAYGHGGFVYLECLRHALLAGGLEIQLGVQESIGSSVVR
jgi:hypothetical protein